MNKLSVARRAEVYSCLVEGVSLRGTVRTTGTANNTIQTIIQDLGGLSVALHRDLMRQLPCRRFQCDEIQSIVRKASHRVWTWTAICIDTRLIACWLVGDRTLQSARPFMLQLRARTSGRVHLTTDQLSSYPKAVYEAFVDRVDYGAISIDHEGLRKPEAYTILGDPDLTLVHNGYVERHNRTIRECLRRFTRRTSGFSKRMDMHEAALGAYFLFYNFCRPNMALRNTFPPKWPKSPAMAAGLTDRVWTLEEVCELIDPWKRVIGAPLQWKLDRAPCYRVPIPSPKPREVVVPA